MELQFMPKSMRCQYQAQWTVQEQEQTQELRLPDDMPDIGRIVGAWGQCVLRGKEWRSNAVGLSGGVTARVLYIPVDETQPKWLETWIPIQFRWNLPEDVPEGIIRSQWLLKAVEGRQLSARKLMLRANVQALTQIVSPLDATVYEPADLPDDVQLLKKTYPVMVPAEAGEKDFTLEESVLGQQNKHEIETVIGVDAAAQLTEQTVLGGKAVFRGSVSLRVIYWGTDGKLHGLQQNVPFSQFADLDQDYDKDAQICVMPQICNLEWEFTEGQLQVKIGLTMQYLIYRRMMVDTVEDAYSPRRDVAFHTTQLQLPVILDMGTQTASLETQLPVRAEDLIAVMTYPVQPELDRFGPSGCVELNAAMQWLYYDSDGQLNMETHAIASKVELDAGHDTMLYPMVSGIENVQLHQQGQQMAAQLPMALRYTAVAQNPMQVMNEMTLSEPKAADPGRPSLVLQRAGDGGLWELAKQNGSTMADIQKVNGLEREPEIGQMLLIPVQ